MIDRVDAAYERIRDVVKREFTKLSLDDKIALAEHLENFILSECDDLEAEREQVGAKEAEENDDEG